MNKIKVLQIIPDFGLAGAEKILRRNELRIEN